MEEREQKEAQDYYLSRRDWLKKSFTAAAGFGLGAFALSSAGIFNPSVTNAMENLSSGALDFTAADTCTLACQTTEGPCWVNVNLIRRNITEGIVGLPMRLAFRVVNADTCLPISNATVEIWHANLVGNYSGLTTNANQCSNDTSVRTQNFGRGSQITDSNGFVYFDSFYPGWYSGRAPHLHLRVYLNSTTIVTTQFVWADQVSELVYRNHPSYTSRPNRDTTNTADNVVGGALSRSLPYILTSKYVKNKYLYCIKTLAIRTTATACNL